MRVVIVEDKEDVRTIMRYVLELDGNIEIVGEAADGLAGLEVIEVSQPDVVVLDVRMPRLNGVDLIRQLRAQGATTRLVAFSSDPASLIAATHAGADAAVLKNSNFDELVSAILG